jgi:hypothetical protein
MADYGSWRPHIVTAATVVGWAASFGWLGVTAPPRWRAGTALYVFGMLGYRVALTFWTAAFPGLARDTPEMHKNERGLADGRISCVAGMEADGSKAEFERRDMLARNNLAHVSFFLCSVGELIVLGILCGIILAVARGDADSNSRALSIVCAYSAGVWGEPTPQRLTQCFVPSLGCSTSSTGQVTNFHPVRRTSPPACGRCTTRSRCAGGSSRPSCSSRPTSCSGTASTRQVRWSKAG